ncbi:MAG TPA: Ig-like domain-containing protein [Candidatus Pristimantibacillus sp.]|nr:Ig-like domain-containing protein [Candidatus Pristimantibacillus sp.]
MRSKQTASKTRAGSRPKRSAKALHPHLRRLHRLHFSLTVVLALAALFGLVVSLGARSSASTCSINSLLVNSCRPWLGAAVGGYPGSTGFAAQIASHESRIGRQLDIVHDYRRPGDVMSNDDKTLAKRANTILLMNWKPSDDWASAGGGNATVNGQIDAMANSIKSLGTSKIMLVIYHEPENDVSPGGDPSCPGLTYKGSSGSSADYVNMWHNVRNRFDALGVNNVVWTMDYMGYVNWDCLVNGLWPGNSYVDWILWNAYGTNSSGDFYSTESRFYNVLSAKSDSTHNYLSKNWGIGEYGETGDTQQQAYDFYDSAVATLNKTIDTPTASGTLPRLKAYIIWDSNQNSDPVQVQYTRSNTLDQTEQDHYNGIAQNPRFTDAYYQGGTQPPAQPPADNTPPVVSLTAPSNGSTVSSTISITGSASDNVSVSSMTLRVDDAYVATDNSSPYSFTLDTTKYADGPHTLTLRAWDPTNNMGEASVTVTVQNQQGGGGSTEPPTAPPVGVITPGTDPPSSPSNPIPVSGVVVVNPSVPGTPVTVKVDGKQLPNNTIDTKKLTNGTHVVTISTNGKVYTEHVSVHNSLPLALVNQVRAHSTLFGAAAGILLVGTLVWFGRLYIFHPFSFAEQRLLRMQHHMPHY